MRGDYVFSRTWGEAGKLGTWERVLFRLRYGGAAEVTGALLDDDPNFTPLKHKRLIKDTVHQYYSFRGSRDSTPNIQEPTGTDPRAQP